MKIKSILLTTTLILGFAFTSISQNLPNYVPTDGLVGWWPFENDTSLTIMDESGYGNHGQRNAFFPLTDLPELATDRHGNMSAYEFGGSFITLPQTIPNHTDYTISLWLNDYNLNNNSNAAYFKTYYEYTTGNWEDAIKISRNTDDVVSFKHRSWVWNGGVWYSIDSEPINSNTWYHLVAVKEGELQSIYINGELQNSSFSPSEHYTGIGGGWANQIYLGGAPVGPPPFVDYLTGKLDDIGSWNRALTQQEITDLFNSDNTTNLEIYTTNNVISLKVYPNPANSNLTLEFLNFEAFGSYTLNIVNSIGQSVVNVPINQQTSYIDVSSWVREIYFVQLLDNQNNNIETRTITIQ
jgi:hypothetical protein